MSAASQLLARQAAQKAGQGAPIADLAVLLTVLSVQQAAGFTATRMREGELPDYAGDQPARMAAIFAPPAGKPGLSQGTAGAFNAAVAAKLPMGADGESGVYSGT